MQLNLTATNLPGNYLNKRNLFLNIFVLLYYSSWVYQSVSGNSVYFLGLQHGKI